MITWFGRAPVYSAAMVSLNSCEAISVLTNATYIGSALQISDPVEFHLKHHNFAQSFITNNQE